jgi:hypothetical protein
MAPVGARILHLPYTSEKPAVNSIDHFPSLFTAPASRALWLEKGTQKSYIALEKGGVR